MNTSTDKIAADHTKTDPAPASKPNRDGKVVMVKSGSLPANAVTRTGKRVLKPMRPVQ